MNAGILRSIIPAHAATSWCSTAALVLIAGLFAVRRFRGTKLHGWGALVATLLASLAGAFGAILHEPYRTQARQRIFLHSRELGWLFERKQHLAFAAILLAWCGVCTLFAAGCTAGAADRSGALRARVLHRAAAVAFASSALFALVASVASAVVMARAGLR